MTKKSEEHSAKTILKLPDLARSEAAVLNSLSLLSLGIGTTEPFDPRPTCAPLFLEPEPT
jgi:hypothetical protein